MIDTRYTCLELQGICTKEQVSDLLRVYAETILQMPEVKADSIFQYLQDDVAEHNKEEEINITTEKLLNYIKIEDINSDSASVVVEAHYEGEADSYELCEEISKFLFSKSSKPYFLMRSAAFDRDGAYAHQWIGYWKDGEVVTEHTDAYFQRVFAQDTAPVLQPA